MESNFFVQFVILTVFVLLCSSHGQYYSGFHRSRYRRISSSGPNPLRYFSQPKHHGLMPGWYRNRQEYWKNHKKRFYSTEEAVENGVMPTMDTMDTGYATPDNLEDGIFQSDQTYPTSQGTLPTAMPQEPSYEQPAAMQPYPDSNTATQTPYPTLAPYSTQASYQTESMLQQYDQAPVAPVSSMLSPSAPLSQLQTQPQQQTQQQPQQITQQQQQQLTQQQPQQLPQQQPQQQQPQQLSQQQSQQQPQQQSQPQPVQHQTMQIPLPQTQSPQPQPQPAQLQPQPLSQPVLAKYPITQQAKPLSSPSPPPSIASTPHNGPYVKVKFKSKNSSRICAPGPPLKPNPRFKNCLVIGDSIAIGYLRTVKLLLREMCQVQHAPFARGSGAVDSRHGVECLSMLLKTTAMEPTHYDAIIFNFGMHDINYSKRFPEEHVSFKEYKKNLKILKQTFLATGAKVAYALTTPHISSKDRNDRIKKYNKGAISVMKSGHSVPVINLYDVIVNRCSEPGNNKFCSIMKGKGDVHYNEEGCRLLGVRVAATFATLINQRATKKHTQSRPRPRFLGQLYLDRYSSVNAVTCPDALTRCPVGTTCCESFLSLTGYGCCMMQDAVTCQDNWHCCPVGTMCSPTCNVRECHCITYLPSSKGKTIKKKIKAKVSLHGKHLKKKKKSASHPRVRVRVLKKLKRRKNRPGKHSGEAKVPNLSTMLSKHKFVKNTTDRPDNNTVELAHLIEHHHKAAYQDLKTYLSGNDAHHNHHRRRHHHHHHHHRHHQHHHNHHEQQYSHRHHHISEEDDISGSMPESTKKSNKKRKSLKIKQISNSGSESGILDDKHDLAGSAQMFNSSGEKDVMSYNDDIILGSGEEYVRGSGMRDSDDDIQGTIGNRMRNTISPVDPFNEVLKSSSKPNKGNNKTKSQSFRGKGHKRNKLKSYLSSNETVKNKYFNAPLSSGDVWNANEFSGERIALKHAAHNANANTANKNSTLHGHHAIRKTFLDSKVGLDDGENDELLSSEFEDTDGSADHDFDLMMSASTSGTKDDISNDGKENLSDEDEDEEKQSGQGEKQSGQGVNQSGQGVNQSGQEVNQSGQEVNQSGQEVSQSGQEVSQSGQEVSQSGQEVSQSGQEVNQSGHEVNQSEQGENQSEQGENQSEQGENQSGQEVNQSGQEINQSGQEANRSNQVVNQSGQGANQSGQEVNQIGQDINQSGQGLNQSGHDINQSGQEVNQSEQEVDQSGQDIKQSGLGLNQSGHDINQSGQEVNQSEQEVNQSGQDINQSGLVLNQSGQDIDQSDQEVNQNDQGVNQSGQEENHSNQAVNQSVQAVNQSVQEVNQNDQGVNQSGQEVNQSGQEVNQSNQVVNQSGEGANQSGQEVNQSNQGANQSSQEVNQNEQGVNQSAQEVMQSGQEVNQSGKEVNHNVQENQSVQGKKQNVREENQSAEEGKTKSNYTLTPSTHYNKRPIDDHLNLMTLSKETWVRGESGGSSKDDTDDIEGRPDDNVTRIDPPSTQEASGQINKELRNELVQLDQLLEEGPSGSGGSSGEYGSSDIVENPLELNETDRDSALNTDPQTDKRLIFFKDDNRTGQSIKDKENINSIKTVKKKIESHSSAWQNHEELMNNLEKKRVFSLNQQKSTTNSSNINVSGVNQFHEPLELEESIRNFTRKDNTVKDQQIYQSDNNVAIRAEKGQQSEVKHNLYENNSTNIVPTNRISQYFSDRGTKRINEQSNLVQLTTNHSEKRGYSENISRTQKQNQRIANNSVTEYNKQKSRTRNSSKRFSLYNNSNNNFSTNKHLISSSRGQKRNGNRLDLEKNIQEDEKLSFESNSKMDNVSSVKDDISNERLDSKHTSSSTGEDTTLEEYLHFR